MADAPSTPARVAIIVDPDQPIGLLANSVAVTAAGLGAAVPEIGGQVLTDRDGRNLANSANRPIPVLQAVAADLSTLLARAIVCPPGAVVIPFPVFARTIHSFDDYQAAFREKDIVAERLIALGLAGPDKWVRSLTGSLKLLR
jgi:hypothetical protein